jgi:hypothetical protein
MIKNKVYLTKRIIHVSSYRYIQMKLILENHHTIFPISSLNGYQKQVHICVTNR